MHNPSSSDVDLKNSNKVVCFVQQWAAGVSTANHLVQFVCLPSVFFFYIDLQKEPNLNVSPITKGI